MQDEEVYGREKAEQEEIYVERPSPSCWGVGEGASDYGSQDATETPDNAATADIERPAV